jgi:hypothetical protein
MKKIYRYSSNTGMIIEEDGYTITPGGHFAFKDRILRDGTVIPRGITVEEFELSREAVIKKLQSIYLKEIEAKRRRIKKLEELLINLK